MPIPISLSFGTSRGYNCFSYPAYPVFLTLPTIEKEGRQGKKVPFGKWNKECAPTVPIPISFSFGTSREYNSKSASPCLPCFLPLPTLEKRLTLPTQKRLIFEGRQGKALFEGRQGKALFEGTLKKRLTLVPPRGPIW